MNYRQTYRYREDGIGWQSVLFVVSDDYNELYSTSGVEADIFILESVKQALNTEEGSYAIDELTFTINQASCDNNDTLNAMFFTLDATNIEVNRYCALFFADQPSVENLLFIGKIHSKVSGSDLKWNSDDYSYEIDPIREYKLTALSFDISILNDAKLKGNVYKVANNQEVRIDNLTERWRANNEQAVSEIFAHRFFYWKNDVLGSSHSYFRPTGNLFAVIQKYLDFASRIILEKHGVDLTLSLVRSHIGVKVNPTGYSVKKVAMSSGVWTWSINQLQQPYDLILADETQQETETTPYIHYKMIDPSIKAINYPESITTKQDREASNAKMFSFLRNETLSELLFDIAKSFACYLFVNYEAGDQIKIEFKSRTDLVESDYTYVIGSEDSDFDTSSILVSGKNDYYATANNYVDEQFDILSEDVLPSEKYKAKMEDIKQNEEKSNSKSERLLFSLSPTLFTPASPGKTPYSFCNPLNEVETGQLVSPVFRPTDKFTTPIDLYLHNSIYVNLNAAPEREVSDVVQAPVIRPACSLMAKVGNNNKFYPRLSDYVNEVMARDKQYYETEYNLTIPFWNSFSKSISGSNPSWKNIKLGSKIILSEIVKRYINGVWQTQRINVDYVVVGIERNLQKPETKLKLHNIERFAYGYWDGNVNDLPSGTEPPGIIEQGIIRNNVNISDYKVSAESANIIEGDAVMSTNDGEVARAICNSANYGKTFGIALQDGVAGDYIQVQTSGEVTCFNYNFDTSHKTLFVRDNSNGINISEVCLDDIEGTEDMVIEIGRVTRNSTFLIDINEWIIEE